MPGPPAARITDMHMCPMTPLPPGLPIIPPTSPNVLIGSLPAARLTDRCACVGPPPANVDLIVTGSMTVLINGLPAARISDATAKGGLVTTGCYTVLIGDAGAGGAGGASVPGGAGPIALWHRIMAKLGIPGGRLAVIADEVNPENSNINCGHIIDAVFDRLMGMDADAVAPDEWDGSWEDIQSRYDTTIDDSSFDDMFKAVKDGGHGTMGLVSIANPNGSSHVAMIANDKGKVGIIEGQGGGHLISDPAEAEQIYNPKGENEIGYGELPDRFE